MPPRPQVQIVEYPQRVAPRDGRVKKQPRQAPIKEPFIVLEYQRAWVMFQSDAVDMTGSMYMALDDAPKLVRALKSAMKRHSQDIEAFKGQASGKRFRMVVKRAKNSPTYQVDRIDTEECHSGTMLMKRAMVDYLIQRLEQEHEKRKRAVGAGFGTPTSTPRKAIQFCF